jgi:hypothetical protein
MSVAAQAQPVYAAQPQPAYGAQPAWPAFQPAPQPVAPPTPPAAPPSYAPYAYAQPAASSTPSGYRSAGTWAALVTVCLIVGMMVDAATIISTLMQVDLLNGLQNGEHFTPDELTANDTRQALFGLAQLGMYLTTAIVFLCWLSRAYRNLPALSKWQPEFGSGWAVGAWFVPLLNLVRPYKIVRETWWVSAHPEEADLAGETHMTSVSPRGNFMLGSWWAVYLLMGFSGQIVFRLALEANTADKLLSASYVGIAADVLSAFGAILALAVVNVVTSSQRATARARLGVS